MTEQQITEAQIADALAEIFADAFGHEVALRPELTARDVPGWDSFKQIEILVAAESRFGIKFTTRDIDALRSVGDLMRIVSVRAGQR